MIKITFIENTMTQVNWLFTGKEISTYRSLLLETVALLVSSLQTGKYYSINKYKEINIQI